MTFRETDYPGVLAEIRAIAQTEKDPALAVARILELIRLDDRIPLYPGIVTMVAKKVVVEKSPTELKPGDLVSFETGGEHITGRVAAIAGNTLQLTDVVRSKRSMSGTFTVLGKVKRINARALEESWPSLVFERKES